MAVAASTGTAGWHTRHDVRVGPEEVHEFDDVVDEVVEVEVAHGERHLARVGPIGDVEIVLRDHRLDGAAQQRRVVTRIGATISTLGS